MKTEKKYLMECHLAARQYYDANEVWNSLTIGTRLELERDKENRYDEKAIAVYYIEETTLERYKVGYIPKGCNEELSVYMDMGWEDLFECRISKISPDAHYEQQIRLTIYVKQRV